MEHSLTFFGSNIPLPPAERARIFYCSDYHLGILALTHFTLSHPPPCHCLGPTPCHTSAIWRWKQLSGHVDQISGQKVLCVGIGEGIHDSQLGSSIRALLQARSAFRFPAATPGNKDSISWVLDAGTWILASGPSDFAAPRRRPSIEKIVLDKEFKVLRLYRLRSGAVWVILRKSQHLNLPSFSPCWTKDYITMTSEVSSTSEFLWYYKLTERSGLYGNSLCYFLGIQLLLSSFNARPFFMSFPGKQRAGSFALGISKCYFQGQTRLDHSLAPEGGSVILSGPPSCGCLPELILSSGLCWSLGYVPVISFSNQVAQTI